MIVVKYDHLIMKVRRPRLLFWSFLKDLICITTYSWKVSWPRLTWFRIQPRLNWFSRPPPRYLMPKNPDWSGLKGNVILKYLLIYVQILKKSLSIHNFEKHYLSLQSFFQSFEAKIIKNKENNICKTHFIYVAL